MPPSLQPPTPLASPCQVWVEREVERVMPAASSKPRVEIKPAPKPVVMKGVGGKKAPRGMVTEDAEELDAKEGKSKGKGKAAAAPKKVVTGAGSILGFFGKK